MIILILKNKGRCREITILIAEYDLNTERQTKLKILSQKRKDLRKQVVRIKQTIEKVLDESKSLVKITRTLFCEQGITIVSILTALSMTIPTIVLAVTDVFGGEGGPAAPMLSLPKDERALKKLIIKLAITLKRFTGKTVAGKLFRHSSGSVAKHQ